MTDTLKKLEVLTRTANHSYLFVGSIAAMLVGIIGVRVWSCKRSPSLARYPVLGEKEFGGVQQRTHAFLSQAGDLFRLGYEQFRSEICRYITADGEHLMVPNCYLDELAKRPDTEVDAIHSAGKVFENAYLHLFPARKKVTVVNTVVRSDLNKNLTRLNPRLHAAIRSAVAAEVSLPPCTTASSSDDDEWTPITLNNVLPRIVASASGDIFFGPELCQSHEYMSCALGFSADLVVAAQILKRMPPWLRPVGNQLIPQARRVRDHRRRMRRFLEPVVAERRRRIVEGGGSENERPDDDLFQWIMERSAEKGINDVGDLTDMMLVTMLASIHTTSLGVTNILYDLVVRPELVEELRTETETVLRDNGDTLTAQALYDMKLADSVMRESQRLNPPFVDSFRRYTLKDIALQNGDRIPALAYIETPSFAVLCDSEKYPDPETFNPHRFFRLRTDPNTPDPLNYKNREQYQFTSVTKENMAFGFGRHACPGRYFAANETKMIMAELLLNYDIKMPEGKERERYKSLAVGVLIIPDPSKVLLFRRRQ